MPATSSVRVVVRTRPTSSFAADCLKVHDDKCCVTATLPKGGEHGKSENAQDSWTWRYDSVLHNASQDTAYADVSPVVKSVLQGYNGTIMCYGQTGAGKTFTQIGDTSSYAHRGIVPRSVAEIFQYISDHPQFDATVGVSYLEIYNDSLVDLLSSLPSEEPQGGALHLIEDVSGATHVKGLRVEKVTNEEEALNMLFEGETNRAVANHQLNRNSTRGHAIFTVYVQIRSRVESSEKVVRCKLNLVDLAGSERLKKTSTEGDMKAESMYINRSLSYLEQVVIALSAKGRSHTPYRQSKLTHLLKDSLGGNCKTLLMANIYGEAQHIEETISTLQVSHGPGPPCPSRPFPHPSPLAHPPPSRAVCGARARGDERGAGERAPGPPAPPQEARAGGRRSQARARDARLPCVSGARLVRSVQRESAR